MFQTLQFDLAKIGVTVTGVGVPSSGYTSKYLSVPSVAKSGVWDMALAIEGRTGTATVPFRCFYLYSGSAPPNGINYWFYNDPVTNQLIQQAMVAKTLAQSTPLWDEADTQVMKDAAVFPIASPLAARSLQRGAQRGVHARVPTVRPD